MFVCDTLLNILWYVEQNFDAAAAETINGEVSFQHIELWVNRCFICWNDVSSNQHLIQTTTKILTVHSEETRARRSINFCRDVLVCRKLCTSKTAFRFFDQIFRFRFFYTNFNFFSSFAVLFLH